MFQLTISLGIIAAVYCYRIAPAYRPYFHESILYIIGLVLLCESTLLMFAARYDDSMLPFLLLVYTTVVLLFIIIELYYVVTQFQRKTDGTGS